jgi:dihydrofolate reductase
VIMGRKTYESIPNKFRPLKNRLNLVLTRSPDQALVGCEVLGSLDAALKRASERADVAKIFVIGGGELYREALQHPACAEVLLTQVHARFTCDTELPPFEHLFVKTKSDGPHTEGGISYTFETYTRRRPT